MTTIFCFSTALFAIKYFINCQYFGPRRPMRQQFTPIQSEISIAQNYESSHKTVISYGQQVLTIQCRYYSLFDVIFLLFASTTKQAKSTSYPQKPTFGCNFLTKSPRRMKDFIDVYVCNQKMGCVDDIGTPRGHHQKNTFQ